MTKYEKILKENPDFKDKVLEILEIVNGETFDDIKTILDAARYFADGCATFNKSAAKDWIESL